MICQGSYCSPDFRAKMRTEIDHLPAKQQGELKRIKQVLMDEFAPVDQELDQADWLRKSENRVV